MKRRTFLDQGALGVGSMFISPTLISPHPTHKKAEKPLPHKPYVLSTWSMPQATQTAGNALDNGMSALEAAVAGVGIEEANVLNTTVGKGGTPNRDGTVSLDACVMNHKGQCGSVMAVENIVHVAALAKAVMEKTPHVILAGKGAQKFAIEQGYVKENLLSEASKRAWKNWLEKGNYKPEINIENHDTIGMLCVDGQGHLSGACTTSGLAYKMAGRVGDSPVIGSGLYIDNAVGGAVATGVGEEVIKTVGSFLIVELMRQGKPPQEACEEAIHRILQNHPNQPDFQVAYLATNKAGAIGAFSIHKGFSYTQYKNNTVQIVAASAQF
ncbi:MAG: isoaspartyl peptidase/L-asparaginase family protein [Flavobacteriaceae bacterium]